MADLYKKIILVMLTLAIAAVGGWYVYKNFLFPEPPMPVDESVPKKLINAQERIIKLASSADLASAIKKLNKLPSGSFEVIFFHIYDGGARHFLTPIEFSLAGGLHLPQKLLSSVDIYNFGIFGSGPKTYPFLILQVSSPETAKEGILAFEKNMFNGLFGIFPDLRNAGSSGGISFQDRVIKNQNARILESGNVQIVYSFYNQRLLIIAPSEEAFSAIISRYSVFPPNSN